MPGNLIVDQREQETTTVGLSAMSYVALFSAREVPLMGEIAAQF